MDGPRLIDRRNFHPIIIHVLANLLFSVKEIQPSLQFIFMRSLLVLLLLSLMESVSSQQRNSNPNARTLISKPSTAIPRLQYDKNLGKNPLAAMDPKILRARGNHSFISFKILQLADLHYTGDPTWKCRASSDVLIQSKKPCSEATTTEFVNALLDKEKPDFVVFSGDEIETFDASKHQAAVDVFTQGVEDRKIPYAVVFGNHDDENDFPRAKILSMVAKKTYSRAQRGPTTVDGVGNYQLGVISPQNGLGSSGGELFRMYFLDSGAYPDKHKYPSTKSAYDWIKQSQIEYYRNMSLLNREGATTPTPAVMFFHIPLPEFADATGSNRNGEENEMPTGPSVNTQLFATLAELNEVKAVFVGHDHENEFCYKRQGIQLCYGGGTGFGQAYGASSFARRARVIEWSMDRQGQRTIRSWKRHFYRLDTKFTEETLYQDSGLK